MDKLRTMFINTYLLLQYILLFIVVTSTISNRFLKFHGFVQCMRNK